jgi:hypothetical protein
MRPTTKIFSKNIVIPSKEIPFFGEAPKMVLGDYRQIRFLRWCSLNDCPESPNLVIRVTRLRAFSSVVVTCGFSGVLVVLFQSHFLSSVLAKFLAKTCYKFMTFWQNRAKFTTVLSWVLAIFASTRKQKSVHLWLLLFQSVGGSSKSHIYCLWRSLSSLSFLI